MSKSEVEREPIALGSLAWFSRPEATGAQDLVVVEVTMMPGHGHSFHKHPDQEEMIYVIEGQIEQWLEHNRRLLSPGDSAFVGKDIVHASFNLSSKPAKFLAVLGPCVGDAGYVAVDVSMEEPWKSLKG